ncbi:hypothetical protein M9H77_29219 [Catharanthus roseus]|uniref:Uncharacterized protein n=1 Tax=Catharanthus roseus TaxID=4058 RepID=A0ACC0AII9_CATRO|nr:hypothetical protein M9H77_29219 [Catharanthus roseus]
MAIKIQPGPDRFDLRAGPFIREWIWIFECGPNGSGLHIDTGSGGGGGVGGGDNLTQWSLQETRDFLMIWAELDSTFMEIKRNKILWEIIAIKMREKGYNINPSQCKGKNLITGYKVW